MARGCDQDDIEEALKMVEKDIKIKLTEEEKAIAISAFIFGVAVGRSSYNKDLFGI